MIRRFLSSTTTRPCVIPCSNCLNPQASRWSPYESGEELLDREDSLDGACVLLDLKLPGLNGLEVLETLARRPYDTSVILVTGYGDETTRARALGAGAVAILQKPVRDELLLRTIRRVLKLRENRGGGKT